MSLLKLHVCFLLCILSPACLHGALPVPLTCNMTGWMLSSVEPHFPHVLVSSVSSHLLSFFLVSVSFFPTFSSLLPAFIIFSLSLIDFMWSLSRSLFLLFSSLPSFLLSILFSCFCSLAFSLYFSLSHHSRFSLPVSSGFPGAGSHWRFVSMCPPVEVKNTPVASQFHCAGTFYTRPPHLMSPLYTRKHSMSSSSGVGMVYVFVERKFKLDFFILFHLSTFYISSMSYLSSISVGFASLSAVCKN